MVSFQYFGYALFRFHPEWAALRCLLCPVPLPVHCPNHPTTRRLPSYYARFLSLKALIISYRVITLCIFFIVKNVLLRGFVILFYVSFALRGEVCNIGEFVIFVVYLIPPTHQRLTHIQSHEHGTRTLKMLFNQINDQPLDFLEHLFYSRCIEHYSFLLAPEYKKGTRACLNIY